MIGLRSFVGYLLVPAREAVEPGAGIDWVLEPGKLSRARVWSRHGMSVGIVGRLLGVGVMLEDGVFRPRWFTRAVRPC